ncbi:hypothetical protein PV783_24650 [Chitinophaga sp. CC14]|uniref:hypothetical protein n=1 Tax=Chitinophaga sp. CC14 TaxID=3029199 RepID=UPI003B7A8273
MRISINVDTHLNSILSLRDELEPVCEKVNEDYRTVEAPSVMGIAIRCLPDNIGRKSFKRYDKKDRYLTIDIAISYEKYKNLQKIEQRHELSHTLYDHVVDAIEKYKFPELIESGFGTDFENWCDEIGWLQNEIDWSLDPEV